MERGSGILTLKTGYWKPPRPGPKLPRPPLSWSLGLILLAAALATLALAHRRSVDRRLAAVWKSGAGVPFEIQKLRLDLSDLEIDEETLSRELETRLDYIQNAENDDFSIVLDTRAKRFQFRLGDNVLREASVAIGPVAPIRSRSGRAWSFAPLTGAFTVKSKSVSPAWKAPEWAYVAAGLAVPDPLPTIPEGLGKYVLELEGGAVIHSAPAPASPLKGAKPGSFLVPEADLAAVWKRVGRQTRVYVF
jgi:hypothetical protein